MRTFFSIKKKGKKTAKDYIYIYYFIKLIYLILFSIISRVIWTGGFKYSPNCKNYSLIDFVKIWSHLHKFAPLFYSLEKHFFPFHFPLSTLISLPICISSSPKTQHNFIFNLVHRHQLFLFIIYLYFYSCFLIHFHSFLDYV